MNFFHDAVRQLLIYESPPLPVLQHVDHVPLNGKFIAIKQTLRNSQILRHYGLPVAPVMDEYDWPAARGIIPWAHQKFAANFAVLHPRSFNLSDLGSGKTLSLLWACDFIMRQQPGTRCLVVAPLSTLHSVWVQSIFANFLGRRTALVLHGSAEKRIDLLSQPADFYLINHDGVGVGAHTRRGLELDGFSKILAAREDIQICVVDEASAYKDAQTKRHRIARLVFGKKPYLFLATGTPTPQYPTDAYGLAKLVNNAFGKSFRTFQQESMYQQGPFKWLPKRDGYEQAARLLTPAIRFHIDDVWKDAPEMTVQTREADLTPEQKTMMSKLKKDLQIIVKSGQPITAANEAAARSKFLQISLGAVYDEGHKPHWVDAAPRLAVLKEVIEQSPRKILLLAPFTHVLTILEKACSEYAYAVVNGATSQKDRTEIFRRFQDEDSPEIIIADPGVLAHGLNLQRGRTIIWYGSVDKAELWQQANKRCHRPGQKHPVSVVQIVSNALEKEIFRRLANNLSLQGAMLDLLGRGEL